jgi:hypothetical protein
VCLYNISEEETMDTVLDIILVASGVVLLLFAARLHYVARTHVTEQTYATEQTFAVVPLEALSAAGLAVGSIQLQLRQFQIDEQIPIPQEIPQAPQTSAGEAPEPPPPAEAPAGEPAAPPTLLELFRYLGKAKLPKRIYAGNSYNITLDLTKESADPSEGKYINIGKPQIEKRGKEELANLPVNLQASGSYLEAELIGAGFTTNSERVQRRTLGADKIDFAWGCKFPDSGICNPAIALRAVTKNNNGEETVESIGRIEQEQSTLVVQLDGMTKRVLDNLTWAAGLLGGASSAAGLIKSGYELGHHFGWW